jgi:hypothetical protein
LLICLVALSLRLSANDSIFTITTLIIPKQQGTSDTVQVRGCWAGGSLYPPLFLIFSVSPVVHM